MAGARAARGARGRYTTAGYAQDQGDLYIARVPAASAQENLRDFNRRGYDALDQHRAERPWRDGPQSVFERGGEAAYASGGAYAAEAVSPRRPRAQGEDFGERLMRLVRQERREVVVCIVLAALILMIIASWGQKMIEGVEIQNRIADFQEKTVELELQNEALAKDIEDARADDRIRNLAQNSLGMLRPERAEHQTIFIQTADLAAPAQQAQEEEPKMELLDILLGLLSVFHIGE